VDRRQRRFLACLTLMALGCLVLQAVTGETQLVLHLTPLFLLVSLLLSGHYVAEERIVAAWLALRPPATRGRRARWALPRNAAVVSLLDRSPLCRRGPPALGALAS
jgi:heme A synthase